MESPTLNPCRQIPSIKKMHKNAEIVYLFQTAHPQFNLWQPKIHTRNGARAGWGKKVGGWAVLSLSTVTDAMAMAT